MSRRVASASAPNSRSGSWAAMKSGLTCIDTTIRLYFASVKPAAESVQNAHLGGRLELGPPVHVAGVHLDVARTQEAEQRLGFPRQALPRRGVQAMERGDLDAAVERSP